MFLSEPLQRHYGRRQVTGPVDAEVAQRGT
jgi:hypothetical protein